MSLRTAKKQQTRADIIRATSLLLEQRGFAATTMRDIAAAAKLSYQTLYNYYPTKALVVQAVLLEEVGDVTTHALAVINGYQGNLLATLYELARVRFTMIERHDRSLWREVVVETLRQQTEFTDLYHEIDAGSLELVQQLFVEAQARGELSLAVDAHLLAKTAFSLSEFVFLEYVMDDTIDAAQALAEMDAQSRLVVSPYLCAPDAG